MDFNSLLRRHLHGEEQGEFRAPSNEDSLIPANARYTFEMTGTGWEGVPRSNTQFGGGPPDEYLAGGSQSGFNHIWNLPPSGGGNDSFHSTPSPPEPAGSSVTTFPNIAGRSSPTILHTHRDAILQSTWFRTNQVEPPIQPSDPLVRLGLVSTEGSRFDLFIHSIGDRHRCLYVEPGSTETCPYSNLRRQRVKVHVLSHFSYKPFVCDGSCGKSDCNLGFADSALLGDHVRRVAKPRAECEICSVRIAPQNYRRHLILMHGANQT